MSAGPPKNGRFPAILDRSPCGSGTAAVMANLWQKGKLKIGSYNYLIFVRMYVCDRIEVEFNGKR